MVFRQNKTMQDKMGQYQHSQHSVSSEKKTLKFSLHSKVPKERSSISHVKKNDV